MNRLWQHRYDSAMQNADPTTRAYQLNGLTEDMRRAASKASLDGEIIVAKFLLQQALKVELSCVHASEK